ncbi:MAG: MoaD/ThiS family protein [Dermatophilaceae bacterium]
MPHGDVDADETPVADPAGAGRSAAARVESAQIGSGPRAEGVDVRYWAAARAAAGVDAERVPTPATVAELLTVLVAARPALAPVLPVCSVLVDGRAARGTDALPAGSTVEILPPFAGG